MASVFKQSDGGYRIDVVIGTARKSIRLGHCPKATAEQAAVWIARLASAKQTSTAPDSQVSLWLSSIDEKLYGRLVAAGLAAPRSSTNLGAFLDKAIGSMTIKPESATFYGHTARCLKEYFKSGMPLRDITPAAADGFKTWLLSDQGLSTATTARRIVAARTFFRIAQRWELLNKNPFDGVKAGGQCNEKRKHFVPLDVVTKILDACPDVQWRCIIALSRFAGIRVPSELLPLKWADINWADNSIVIHSPKTEHHDGGASRTIPLFTELRPYLLEAFEAAEPGAEYVITAYRDTTQNLRTQFERIARRAGVALWPKPFHNMRASRESELMREYDLATVCKWIGNSPAIAARHYATSIDLDADFRRAAGQAVEKTAAYSAAVCSRTDVQGCEAKIENAENSRVFTSMQVCTQRDMGDTGFEPVTSCVSCMRSNQLS